MDSPMNILNGTVPVFLAGMWPSRPEQPESGTRVAIIEKEGGPVLLEGFSDLLGEFRGRLPVGWVGNTVLVVVRETGFKYNYFNPVRVERWGLFLAVCQEKDYFYNGSEGAKSIDPSGWEKWNSTQEHINASEKVHAAVRCAKIAWPLRPFGFAVALLGGVAGFFVNPVIGFIIGVGSYIGTELLAQFLLNRGY
jgi:hypothetical protein